MTALVERRRGMLVVVDALIAATALHHGSSQTSRELLCRCSACGELAWS